jgi:hypothetical protein
LSVEYFYFILIFSCQVYFLRCGQFFQVLSFFFPFGFAGLDATVTPHLSYWLGLGPGKEGHTTTGGS